MFSFLLLYLINSKLLTIYFYFRRLSDVLKRKKPPKRSLGRKCKNSEESPTEAPPKGSSAVGNRSSSRAKSAGIALYYLSYHAYKTIQNNNVITLSCYIISDDYSYFPLTKKFWKLQDMVRTGKKGGSCGHDRMIFVFSTTYQCLSPLKS